MSLDITKDLCFNYLNKSLGSDRTWTHATCQDNASIK